VRKANVGLDSLMGIDVGSCLVCGFFETQRHRATEKSVEVATRRQTVGSSS
jgi:predicted patatin/cPLA2 family phospholipase